jgi:hypothetical protein
MDRDGILHVILKYQPVGICLMFIHTCPTFVPFCSDGFQLPTLTDSSHTIQTVQTQIPATIPPSSFNTDIWIIQSVPGGMYNTSVGRSLC